MGIYRISHYLIKSEITFVRWRYQNRQRAAKPQREWDVGVLFDKRFKMNYVSGTKLPRNTGQTRLSYDVKNNADLAG